MTGPSRTLAEFIVDTTVELPPPARRASTEAFTLCAARAVVGAHGRAAEALGAVAASLAVPAEAAVLGRRGRTGLIWAPLLHGTAMTAANGPAPEWLRLAAPVVATTLTATQATGAVVLSAMALGLEVAARVDAALGAGHRALGWDPAGSAGRLGAVAAAARLFGLTADQTVVALGIASVEAAGLSEAHGSMTEALHVGTAARDGVETALLAARDLTGPPEPLGARRGLFALMTAGDGEQELLTRELGSVWRVAGWHLEPEEHPSAYNPLVPEGFLATAMCVADLNELAPLFASSVASG